MWNSLCFRNMGVALKEEKDKLRHGIVEDQFIVTKNDRHTGTPSSRRAVWNDFLGTISANKCKLFSARTVIKGENLKLTLLRAHKGFLVDDNN